MNMKKNILYLLFILLVSGMTGCKELDIERYENAPRLYFFKGQNNGYQHSDSIAQSFFLLPKNQNRDTVWIIVETMGLASDQPRPFKLVQNNIGDADAAVAGIHYLSFESEEMKKNMMIPANSVRYHMPLIVLRDDPALKTSIFRLELAIAENDYFKVGIETQSNFVVTITADAIPPKNWWRRSFGTWGAQKMWFISTYLGIKDFNEPESSDTNYQNYLKALATQKLAEYNANPDNPNTPLQEANGTLVKF